ncbi:MAG: transposase, IS605 OrfB family, central region [Halorubrum sp. J07HR59]|nr:MAG: transposase, IS605 OrfB family, central region [Halorubrum sp. J07HR59]
MKYTFRYQAYPDRVGVTSDVLRHIDIHRQAYNYTRYEYQTLDDDEYNIGSAYKHHKRLKTWKNEFPVFSEVHSKALQATVKRFYSNLSGLSELKKNGQKVGMLRWKPPREFRSMTYSQSGFKLKNTSGQTATLWLSGIGDIPMRYHRDIPPHTTIKEVTIKQETTGEWFVSFGLEMPDDALPSKSNLDEIDPQDCVGIDLGITNYIHTSENLTVDTLDLSDEYERLRREQRNLARKEHGSNNWEAHRKQVAKANREIKRKVTDFQHKLTTWLVTEYDLVAVEDLDVKPMLEDSHNAKNKQDAAWSRFVDFLQYKADLHGTHVVKVDPAGTTKQCASCGVATDKPLWVREHSCPACGHTQDRDLNAAKNILNRGLKQVGAGRSESTPMQTALPTFTPQRVEVDAKRVDEMGSLGA